MSLMELQRRVAAAILAPLTPTGAEVRAFIKPNDRLTSLERLDIYRRSYWERVLHSLGDDFPGLRAILGQRAYDRLAKAYLADTPSRSFTLRNLGSRLEDWLLAHPSFAGRNAALALDMIRLEWAHIEAFDGPEEKPLGPEDLLEPGPETRLALQPHMTLLQLQYPVDDLRIRAQRENRSLVRHCSRLKAEPIYVAVHRADFMVYYRRLAAEEFRILESLRHGASLEEAIDSTAEPGHIETWFAAWSRLGWLCHSRRESQ